MLSTITKLHHNAEYRIAITWYCSGSALLVKIVMVTVNGVHAICIVELDEKSTVLSVFDQLFKL